MIGKLKHCALGTALAAVLPLAPAAAQEFPIDTAGISKAVISETNAYRASKNLPAVQENAALQAAATAYAKFLAEKEAAGHTADGQTPAKRVKAQGYQYCHVAENMWGGWRRPDPMSDDQAASKAMDDWKKSPGHNANLLGKQAVDIGIGAAAWRQSGNRVVFRIVQVFGKDCSGKSGPTASFGDVVNAVGKQLR
ncbi:MAG TPA: CAP domain-containing protein [Geobacterales bacterium]|nr:CAP domain-containing protein [Geobacterales bacterium]